jgi:Flp pilus assembly protein TadD
VDQALTVDPEFGRAHVLRGLLLCQQGAAGAAVELLEHLKLVGGSEDPVIGGLLGYAYALAGRSADARGEIAWLQSLRRGRYVPVEYAAMIHIALGEHDRALAMLEQVLEQRSSSMIYLRQEPMVDPLRADPRFERILAAVERRAG